MKLKTSILLATSLVLAAGAQAATITWTSNGLTGATDVRATGSVLAYVPNGTSAAQTVNGVAFSTAATQNSVTLAVTTGGSGGWTGTVGDNQLGSMTDVGGSVEYKHLLDGCQWSMNTPTITLSFSGLTQNQQYEIRVWAADYRVQGAGRSVTVDGGTTVVDYNGLDSTTVGATTGGGFFTGVFTADATSQAFTLTGLKPSQPVDASAQYNALQLSAIPEPSAALLGGLGMLALLRRRRA